MQNIQEIIAKLRQVKAEKGYSNQEIADLTGVPKGTVDRVFGSKLYSFTYETIQPMVKVLLKVNDKGATAEDLKMRSDEYVELLKTVIAAKNTDIDALKEELTELRNLHKTEVAELKNEHKAELLHMRKAAKSLRLAIIIMSAIISVLLILDISLASFGWFKF